MVSPSVSWADNARDILNFMLYAFPDLFENDALPFMIPPISAVRANERRLSGFVDRLVLGVGHSLGGGSLYVQPCLSLIEYPSHSL